MDNPTHSDVLVGAACDATVVVFVGAFVVLETVACGGCLDAHPAAATHAAAMTTMDLIAFDMGADLSRGWFGNRRYGDAR
ncbi:hypothetical protein MCNS_33710 [Mycobacterium conspicuum]|jgi:AhpD family alkylhydroperoxidase|uniref:Uncharacterized protein n=1 Tax=Mycobacterium conspicuum TaxID=44010 RepID=A0A7I7YEU8_9MYCO|nr:hypothetical protein MCNS_33710 [Mycobacterium conspicuum]